jgi:hypothetical protein
VSYPSQAQPEPTWHSFPAAMQLGLVEEVCPNLRAGWVYTRSGGLPGPGPHLLLDFTGDLSEDVSPFPDPRLPEDPGGGNHGVVQPSSSHRQSDTA